jgi:hypothetical protein
MADDQDSDGRYDMKWPANPKYWLKRLLIIVATVEIVWVVVVNALLYLPLTQSVINSIRPEKFHVAWDSAWSWYPGHVQVRGASANGNSRRQIWQFEADSVSGSVALVPLIFKRVWLRDVAATDVDIRLRPRPLPGKDYTDVEAFFPEIEGRPVTPAVTTPRKKKRTWKISVRDSELSGNHRFWLYQFQGSASGYARGDLNYRSHGGPFSLDVSDLSLDLSTRYRSGDNEIFRQGKVSGSMGFDPFIPRENRGLPLLDYLRLDLDLEVGVNSLEFIRLFALTLQGFGVDGTGQLAGRLRFERGQVLDGTELSIDAEDLRVGLLAHRILGTGTVRLAMGRETGGLLDLVFRFGDLDVFHDEDQRASLKGENLVLRIGGDGRLIPIPGQINPSRLIGLEIDGLAVPDLALLQRYLPQKWPLRFHGGTGILDGKARISATALSVDLELDSNEADMGVQQYRFLTNLDAALKLSNPSVATQGTRVAGTFLALSNARLQRETDSGKPWSASLNFNDGELSLIAAEDKARDDSIVDLIRILGNSEMKQLAGGIEGWLDFDASVSSLAWIDVLLGGAYRARFEGTSGIEGVIKLADGLPAPGTQIRANPEQLVVKILDYVSQGNGKIELEVEEGGIAPDWRMSVDLDQADLRRRSDSTAYIRDVELNLEALVKDVTFDPEQQKRFALALRIPTARVTDMSAFNSYLPPDSPARFTAGRAILGADVLLEDDDADGWVKLDSSDVRLEADRQSLVADLGVDIRLSGGIPSEMKFDITGSRVALNNVRVTGEKSGFESGDWSAILELTRGETVFVEPIELDLEADLSMSDSRPIVALFRNQEGWRPAFIAEALTVEDITGTAELEMADDQMVVPEAWVTSDNLDVGMKAVIAGDRRDGVIYLKYKSLDALLKIRDGRKNLDLIRVKKTYDEYRAGAPH